MILRVIAIEPNGISNYCQRLFRAGCDRRGEAIAGYGETRLEATHQKKR